MLKYLFFIGIFCTAAADLKLLTHNGRDKSVNLALETVLEFDKENKETDVNILNKVNSFIGKIKNVIENKNILRRNMKRGNKNIFTDFIVNLIQTLIKYEDSDLEYFVLIINSEIKRHRGSILQELAENTDFHKVFADKFAEIKNKPAKEIRHYLKALANKLSGELYIKKEEELLDTLNSMYKEDSVPKFNQFIEDMDDYRLKARKNIDLSQLVRRGLKSILFDPYSNLQVYSRSMLTTKLRDYIKYFYDFVNDDPKYTTNIQAVSELRTRSENYMENILNLSALKEYYARWVRDIRNRKNSTTQMTHRPHSVPTTRKTKTEITKEDHGVKLKKGHKEPKNVKHRTISKKDTTMYKERGDKTSEEGITLRQMYAEKNLDLKYDPYAYDHLTTDMKRNKGIVDPPTSPKTHRPYKKTLLERSPKLKEMQNHDSDISDELEPKLDDMDSDSADSSKFTSKMQISSKYTETPDHFGETVNYDAEPEFRSQKKEFMIELSTTTSSASKADFAEPRSEYKMRSEKRGSYEDRELYTFQPGRPNVIELVKDIGYSIDIKKEKDLDLLNEQPHVNNSRYKREHYRKDSSRTFRDHLKPANILSWLLQNRDSLKPKLKVSKNHFDSQHNVGRQQYRRHDIKVPIISHEGLSIEEFSHVNNKRYYRRNNNSNTTVNDDNEVLGRIQHLENELKLVKTQIKNDTNAKDLVPQVENGIEPKSVDTESTIKTRNNNNDDLSSKGPNIFEKQIIEQSPNLNQEVQVIESKYDVNRFINKLNIQNDLMFKSKNFSKPVSTLKSNNANQSRMYFPKSELIKVSQLVATDLQPNGIKEIEEDQKADNSGLAFRMRNEETTSMPEVKLELKTNDKIFPTQGTTSNVLDSTAKPSKMIRELTQEIGEQLAGLSNASVEKNSHNGETDKNKDAMNLHLVLNSGPTQNINNETWLR